MMLKLRKPSDLKITHADLVAFLRYDRDSGEFHYITRPPYRRHGPLGCNDNGYRRLKVFGQYYLAHRLAWFYVTGEWPKHFIDHKDGNPSNNAFSNLRECTQSQNVANARRPNLGRPATSKYKGVSWNKVEKKWCAFVRVEGRLKNLGYFKTEELAHEAYVAAAREHYGEFARLA